MTDTAARIIAPPLVEWHSQTEQQQFEGPESTPAAPAAPAEGTAPAAASAAPAVPTPLDVAAQIRSRSMGGSAPAAPTAPAAPAAPATAPTEDEGPLEVEGQEPIPFAQLDPATQAYVRGLRAQNRSLRLSGQPAPAAPAPAPAAPAAPVAPAAPAADQNAVAALVALLQAAGVPLAQAQAGAPATAALAGAAPAAPGVVAQAVAAAQTTGPSAERQILALRVAGRPAVGVDGDRLLDSTRFRDRLAALESADDASVTALVQEFVTNDGSLRITPAAAGSGGAHHTGTTPVRVRAGLHDALSKSPIGQAARTPSTRR